MESKILELLGKYDCHLRRGTQNMADFLENNFREYINDLQQSIAVKDNLFVGKKMCEMIAECIDEISSNADDLVDVLRLYSSGEMTKAKNRAFEVFDIMKPQLMQRYSRIPPVDVYYRIRKIGSDPFPLERKELFHIPYGKNCSPSAGRYSTSDDLCLYLASQAELAWQECGSPEKFAVSKFSISEEKSPLKFIDFSENLLLLKAAFYSWFPGENDKDAIRKYLLKHIYTYPLRASCSVAVQQHQDIESAEEYIIPQLLLQWVCNDEDFDGIRYESCAYSDDVQAYYAHNIVLWTKIFDADGYDKKLREHIKVGEPEIFDIKEIKCDETLIELLNKNGALSSIPFLWDIENISDNYQTI